MADVKEDKHDDRDEPVGRGIVDWKKIFEAALKGGLKHFYVEQDKCDRDSLESAKISYECLHNLKL
jgi:sugar phosphate isomerase/epimerase